VYLTGSLGRGMQESCKSLSSDSAYAHSTTVSTGPKRWLSEQHIVARCMAEQGREALDSEAASLTPTISFKSLCANNALLCCLRSLKDAQASYRAERRGRRRARTTIEDFTQTYFRYHDLRVPEVILLLARHGTPGVRAQSGGPDGLLHARAGLLQALGHPHLCRRQAPQRLGNTANSSAGCLFGCVVWE